jgi:hypothetical protein
MKMGKMGIITAAVDQDTFDKLGPIADRIAEAITGIGLPRGWTPHMIAWGKILQGAADLDFDLMVKPDLDRVL